MKVKKRNLSLIGFYVYALKLALQYAVVDLQVGLAVFCHGVDFAGSSVFFLFFAFKEAFLF